LGKNRNFRQNSNLGQKPKLWTKNPFFSATWKENICNSWILFEPFCAFFGVFRVAWHPYVKRFYSAVYQKTVERGRNRAHYPLANHEHSFSKFITIFKDFEILKSKFWKTKIIRISSIKVALFAKIILLPKRPERSHFLYTFCLIFSVTWYNIFSDRNFGRTKNFLSKIKILLKNGFFKSKTFSKKNPEIPRQLQASKPITASECPFMYFVPEFITMTPFFKDGPTFVLQVWEYGNF